LAQAALIVNPQASGVTPELTLAVERELSAVGKVETILTERPFQAAELAEELGGNVEQLYVFSGDGGYNEVVNGLAADIPVGFIPGGSTSVLPRALGLPRDPREAARLLARGATTRRISLGRVNGRRFTFSAGLGLDAGSMRSAATAANVRATSPLCARCSACSPSAVPASTRRWKSWAWGP
jgi:diacylglycerol kinase family enzyme